MSLTAYERFLFRVYLNGYYAGSNLSEAQPNPYPFNMSKGSPWVAWQKGLSDAILGFVAEPHLAFPGGSAVGYIESKLVEYGLKDTTDATDS